LGKPKPCQQASDNSHQNTCETVWQNYKTRLAEAVHYNTKFDSNFDLEEK